MNQSLKHHHWAGLTDYTSLFRLAISYVFDKQSGSPCHCDLLMHLIDTSIDTPYTEDTGLDCRVPLSRLSFHALAFSARVPVSVLGTANCTLCTNFSRALGINSFPSLLSSASYHYDPQNSTTKHPSGYLHIPKLFRALNEYSQFRNINLMSIRDIQLRYHLGTD